MWHFAKNRPLLFRIGTVLAGIWLAIIFIKSIISRDFSWFPQPYGFDAVFRGWPVGPALLVAVVGIAIIYAVCCGLPWIAAASDHK